MRTFQVSIGPREEPRLSLQVQAESAVAALELADALRIGDERMEVRPVVLASQTEDLVAAFRTAGAL